MIDKLRPPKIIRCCVVLVMLLFIFGCKSKVVSPKKTAESYGLKVHIQPEKYTISDLVQSIVKYYK